MTTLLKNKTNRLVLSVFLLATFLLTSCDKDDDKKDDDNNVTPETVKLADNPTLGKILTDSKGLTLYYFTKDPAQTSNCEGDCLTAWPVFYEEEIKVPAGLNASDFSTITREDNAKQTTYKGWPLYYYYEDEKPGDIAGEDVGNVWFVAKPDYSLMVVDNEVGEEEARYFVDAAGKTLYYFTNDTEANKSACSGGCISNWPQFNTENIVLPSYLSKADFTSFTREDNQKQMAYKGKPLYYFKNDLKRGETKGQGVIDKWFVAIP